MGFGVSIFLITVGAIFKWAIKAHISGIDLPALGVIFMAVGGASFILQLVLMNRQPKNSARDVFTEDRGNGNLPSRPE
ncbi:hypothetical protein GCM10029978_114960 [Actinoallomurus acanthiterrae]